MFGCLVTGVEGGAKPSIGQYRDCPLHVSTHNINVDVVIITKSILIIYIDIYLRKKTFSIAFESSRSTNTNQKLISQKLMNIEYEIQTENQ